MEFIFTTLKKHLYKIGIWRWWCIDVQVCPKLWYYNSIYISRGHI